MAADTMILRNVFGVKAKEELPTEVLQFCQDYCDIRSLAGLPPAPIPEEVLLPFLVYWMRQNAVSQPEIVTDDDDWFTSGTATPPAASRPRSEPTFMKRKRENPQQWLSEDGTAKRYPGVGELDGVDLSDRSLPAEPPSPQ